MSTEFVHIMFGNILAVNKVVGIGSPGSAPTKRLIKKSEENGLLIDMTNGRKTKAVIFMDSGHIVLAAITPEGIKKRHEFGGESEG